MTVMDRTEIEDLDDDHGTERPRKVYRVVLMVVGDDDLDPSAVCSELENAHYSNHCMTPSVMQIDAREVEWTDNHPLNLRSTQKMSFDALFADVK